MNFELEQELNLNSTNEVEFNLSTAQKYLTKLKSHQKSTSFDDYSGHTSRNRRSSYGPNTESCIDTSDMAKVHDSCNFQVNVEKLINKAKELRTETRNISYDIINIKNAVHKKNSDNGIDVILSSIDFLNAELSNWKSIEKNSDNVTHYENSHLLKFAFDKAKDESNNGKTPLFPSMIVSVYSPDFIANKIKVITNAINKLEEQRDTLNVNTKIQVKISNKSKEVLGL